MKRRNGVTFKHVYFLAFLKEHAELLDRVLVKFEDDLVRKVAA